MKKSMYQAIRLFLFSLLLPLLGLILNSLRLFNPEIAYDSPVLLAVSYTHLTLPTNREV